MQRVATKNVRSFVGALSQSIFLDTIGRSVHSFLASEKYHEIFYCAEFSIVRYLFLADSDFGGCLIGTQAGYWFQPIAYTWVSSSIPRTYATFAIVRWVECTCCAVLPNNNR